MSLEGLSKEQIEQYQNDLLAQVPETGPIGNVSLRTILQKNGWSEDLYWGVRNRLIESGLLATGRGKGGSVHRIPPSPPPGGEPPVESMSDTVTVTATRAERELYQPMADVIRGSWAQDYRLDSVIVEVTASQGARPTGGKWTRPDITVASYRTFPYVPGRHFDLITFEVKPGEVADVTVVYEALGHRRAATRAFALLHVPEYKRDELDSLLEEIALEAKRFGIGIIVAADPGNYDTWEELVEAVRQEPDPERLNDFLALQVSQGFREQIMKWFK